jgi:hypothetical protein
MTLTRKAAQYTTHVLKEFLIPQIEKVIDEEKKVMHSRERRRVE